MLSPFCPPVRLSLCPSIRSRIRAINPTVRVLLLVDTDLHERRSVRAYVCQFPRL